MERDVELWSLSKPENGVDASSLLLLLLLLALLVFTLGIL